MSDTTSTAPVTTEAPPTPEVAKPPAEAAKPAEAAEPAKAAPAPPRAQDWAKLSAEEKRNRKRADELAAREREIAERAKALDEIAGLKTRAKAGDPEAIARLVDEFGIDYDKLTQYHLRGRKVDPTEKTARELAELKAQLEREREEAAQRAESESWQATIGAFRSHVTKESADDFPLLSGEIEADPDLIDATLKSMAKAEPSLTIRDAALRMERYFREQTERRAARLPKPTAPQASPTPETSSQDTPRDQRTGRFARGDGPRTRLTNDLAAERAAPPKGKEPGRKLTQRERDLEERERIRRAANAMR
jgi:hypothetical protein